MFKTTWVVPPAPSTQSGQTIFLFNGIQNSTMIYQPVLQWGPSAAGGEKLLGGGEMDADGQAGQLFDSQLVQVNTGNTLVGIMTLTSQSGAQFSYNCQFQGIANASLPIQNVQQLTWCIETLEAYGINHASDYPATLKTAMTSIELKVGTAEAHLSWAATNLVTDTGQHAVVVSNASPGGEVDLYYSSPLKTLFASGNMGQGSGALSWLVGDVNGDGLSEIVQPWNDGGSLGVIVYHWTGSAMATLWASGNLGQGSGAVSWLVGDVNKDGRAEIIQLWNDNGSLGMIVYHWTGSAMATLWASGNVGQGSGAVSWLVGDVNKDGQAEIIQLWNDNGSLGMIVYHWTGSAMATLWASGNLGQGSGAVSWLVGDVNKDGQAEIIQLWNDNGSLGMIVYHWTGSAMATLWASGNVGQGSGAVSWLVGDVNKDGQAEIIQLWNDNGSLGMIVYHWTGSAMATLWGTGNVGQGSGAVSWLVGDVDKDGQAEIIQLWNNGGSLGMIVYYWTGSAMTTLWGTGNVGQGSGAVSWLIGDFNGDGRAKIAQQWNNGGHLGMIVYEYTA